MKNRFDFPCNTIDYLVHLLSDIWRVDRAAKELAWKASKV